MFKLEKVGNKELGKHKTENKADEKLMVNQAKFKSTYSTG